MNEYCSLIDDLLANQPWWYGEQWSVVDAQLYWIYWRVAGTDYDVGPFGNFQEHAKRMEDRPSTQRALAHEGEAQAQHEAEGLAFEPPSIE